MEKRLKRRIKILLAVIVVLVFFIIGGITYFNQEIDNMKKDSLSRVESMFGILKKVNKVIELNRLNTEEFTYYINPSDWEDTLKKETGLTLEIPNNWTKNEVVVRKDNNDESLSVFEITLDIKGNIVFNDFVDTLYKKLKNEFETVESFKEGKGYYEINSFSEATYNNMYYDYVTTLEDGSTGGPKVKIKLLELEKNKIKIEINKF